MHGHMDGRKNGKMSLRERMEILDYVAYGRTS